VENEQTKTCSSSDSNKYTYNSDSGISMTDEENCSDDDWKVELDQYFERKSVGL